MEHILTAIWQFVQEQKEVQQKILSSLEEIQAIQKSQFPLPPKPSIKTKGDQLRDYLNAHKSNSLITFMNRFKVKSTDDYLHVTPEQILSVYKCGQQAVDLYNKHLADFLELYDRKTEVIQSKLNL